MGVKPVIQIFLLLLEKELFPCFPRKIGNLAQYTVRLHKPNIKDDTVLFSRQVIEQTNTIFWYF